jgi:AcrR family transcriptional regulator
MSDQKRPYRMQRRAEAEEQTRLRITESAVALHEELGPAHTTVSAIAERAGVRRSTVYRHFPDEATLFDACSSHWSALHPPPDPAAWASVEDALTAIYTYYAATEPMYVSLLRDEPLVPLVAERLQAYHDYLASIRDRFARGRRARAALGHALAFATWRSLVREQGLRNREAVDLMAELVVGR